MASHGPAPPARATGRSARAPRLSPARRTALRPGGGAARRPAIGSPPEAPLRTPLRPLPWSLALVALLLPAVARAHAAGVASGSGFAAGFLHPLSGLDHVLAMLAVGLWGAQLGPPALWALPIGFPLVMAFGGVAGIVGVPLPSVEAGIALSVIVLGAVIALDQRPPLLVAWLLVAFFAVFHGYAHGVELPHRAGALAYSAGFVTATGLIHLTGIALGSVVHLRGGLTLLRAGGSLISVAGLYLAWLVFVS